MATTRVIKEPSGREVQVGGDRKLGKGMPFRISWSALFAGTFAALGVWLLLYALGAALGLSSVDPSDPSSLRSTGVFTGIWGLVTPLIALFIGGVIAARTAGPLSRNGGAIHGLVVWSLAAVAGVWLLATVVGGLVGTAASVGKSAAEVMGQQQAQKAQPPGGVAGELQEKLPGGGEIGQQALEAAPKTGTAFWVVFGSLLLGLIAAVLGGLVGVTREQRRMAEEIGVVPVTGIGGRGEIREGREGREAREGIERRRMPGEVREGGVVTTQQPPPPAQPQQPQHEAQQVSHPQMDQLRKELAELRAEVREALGRGEELRH